MKAVELLIESMLPPEARRAGRVYDSKDLDEILATVGKVAPDQFVTIQHKLAAIGRNATWRRGDTVRLSDLNQVIDKSAMLKQMDTEVAQARKDFRGNTQGFETARNEIYVRYSTLAEKLTMDIARSAPGSNNVITAVASGARGKPAQVKAMLTTPGVYSDSKDRLIPVFVRHSYSEGVRPGEFLAGTYGARQAVTAAKTATARGGELLKLASAATGRMVITKNDCETRAGVAFTPDDPSIKYRVLLKDTAGFKAGTYIDGRVSSALKQSGVKSIQTRSPMTCSLQEGLCAKCAGGYLTDGKLPHIGDHIGSTAAASIFEPVVQGSLGSKHTAGITSTKKSFSGLDALTQFMQAPDTMEYRAAIAEDSGDVNKIEEAPQGGHFVHVGNSQYYVKPGYEILVKPGDKLEAGDQISDGVVDAKDILKTRGLGEGRLHYANELKKILDASGLKVTRNQTEFIARGAIDHVNIDDEEGFNGHLPDDTTSYNSLRATMRPDDTDEDMDLDRAVGNYLKDEALHFTVGTRLTPRMAQQIKDGGIDTVRVNKSKPGFTPFMPRIRVAAHEQDDWLGLLGTNYLSRNMHDALTRGADSDVESNVNFIPRLAIGQDFGKDIRTTGKF